MEELMCKNYKCLCIFSFVFLFFCGASEASDYRVSIYQKEKVFNGTTFLADASNRDQQRIVEVDFNGNILWQYKLPKSMQGQNSVLLEATPLPNKNILFTVKRHGIFEINRKGKIIWKHLDRDASHDADRLANGNTLYNHGFVKKGAAQVVEITPQGKTVWSWDGIKEFGSGFYADFFNDGWMHVNAVTRLENGNTLISIRNFNKIVEVNPSGKVVWEITFRGKIDVGRNMKPTDGPIKGITNHEPEITPSGTLLLALRKPWRFVEIDRQTKTIVWQWAHPEGRKAMDVNRDANRLPNGNTLGTTADRIIEVSADGEIVWQLHAPESGSGKTAGKGRGRAGSNKRAGKGKHVQQQTEKKFHKVIRLSPDGKIFGG